MKRTLPILLAGLVLVPWRLSADEEKTYSNASLSAPFENLAGSARFLGLAGAYNGDGDDASAMLQNPASLGEMKTGQVALHHHNWIADVTEETAIVGVPLGVPGGLGLMADYVNYGLFDGRDEEGNPTRPLGASDIGLGAGWGWRILGPVFGGGAVKMLRQTLADQSYYGYSTDFGLLVAAEKGFRAGISFSNLATPLADSQRASEFRASASYLFSHPGGFGLLLGTGFDYQPGSTSRIRFGMEPSYKNALFARIGYQAAMEMTDREGLQGLALGAGFKYHDIQVDYAYTPFSDLGDVQRISLAFFYGQAPRDQPAPSTVLGSGNAAVLPPPPSPSPDQALPVTENAESLELYFHVPKDTTPTARGPVEQAKTLQAIEALRLAIASQPGAAALWKELGDLYLRLGQKDYAIKCYQESNRLLSVTLPATQSDK